MRALLSFLSLLFVFATTPAFAGETDERLAALIKIAGTVEQAQKMIKGCRERAVASSKELAANAASQGSLAKYTMAVIETVCESEVIHQSKQKMVR